MTITTENWLPDALASQVMYSNMDAGTGYVAYPASDSLGMDDYDTIETTTTVVLKDSFGFVGGVPNADESRSILISTTSLPTNGKRACRHVQQRRQLHLRYHPWLRY